MTLRRMSTSLGLTLLFLVGGAGITLAAEGRVCTSSDDICYDTRTKTNRICTTKTCTYPDGHKTTTTTVNALPPNGGGTSGGNKATGQGPIPTTGVNRAASGSTGGKPLTTTINPALQQNVLQKGTAGGSTGPTKPTLPIAGGQRQ
jgi:hypothetical protein